MNGKERIEAVLKGEKPDVIPVFPKISYANTLAVPGMMIRDYMTDPEAMKNATISAYRKFGWDGVALHTDIGSEGRAMGSTYELPEDGATLLVKHLLDDISQLERIKIPDPQTAPGMSVVIEAVRRVVKEIGNEAYVIAWTNGPLNVASQVFDMNSLLMATIDEPEKVHALLELCLQVSITYGKALIDAGAMGIAYGHAMASSNMISPASYKKFSFPYEKRLVKALLDHGAKSVITHICGNIDPIIDSINEIGSTIIDFDYVMDVQKLLGRTPKVIRGNINPAVLVYSSAQEVYDQTKELVMNGKGSNRLIVGSGCEIQKNTPPDNLHAMVQAAREFGS